MKLDQNVISHQNQYFMDLTFCCSPVSPSTAFVYSNYPLLPPTTHSDFKFKVRKKGVLGSPWCFAWQPTSTRSPGV